MQRSESTFSWQHALPHQPVPSLAHTLRLLLETLRPLAHAPHELARCRRLADELLATGAADARQKWLQALAKTIYISPEETRRRGEPKQGSFNTTARAGGREECAQEKGQGDYDIGSVVKQRTVTVTVTQYYVL